MASPPCNCFSVASIGKYWTGGKHAYIPKNDKAKQAIDLLKYTLKLIETLRPVYWVVENPVGMMRTLPFMQPLHHRVITQCQYGERRMKPTDLWGHFPPGFSARRCRNGDKCHDKAPRGSHKAGIQSIKSPELKSKIPYKLALVFCLACEGLEFHVIPHQLLLASTRVKG